MLKIRKPKKSNHFAFLVCFFDKLLPSHLQQWFRKNLVLLPYVHLCIGVYILTPATHTNCMENSKSTIKSKTSKKTNPVKKIGKSIKETFIEMSNSLAGWIDDTGTQFSSKKSTKHSSQSSSSTSSRSGAKFTSSKS